MRIIAYPVSVYSLNTLKFVFPSRLAKLSNIKGMSLKMKAFQMISHPRFLKPKEDRLLAIFYSSNWLTEFSIFPEYYPNTKLP